MTASSSAGRVTKVMRSGGRGWAVLADDGSLQGHLYFHLGDDSGFRAVRGEQESRVASSGRRVDERDV
jgi:hypothetical protein